jgi:hypothetical protein
MNTKRSALPCSVCAGSHVRLLKSWLGYFERCRDCGYERAMGNAEAFMIYGDPDAPEPVGLLHWCTGCGAAVDRPDSMCLPCAARR